MDAPDKPNRLHKFVSYIVLYNMLWYPMSKFYAIEEGDGENKFLRFDIVGRIAYII